MKVVIATSNTGKLAELERLLDGLDLTLTTQGALGIEAAEETASTFMENALAKARHAALLSGLPAIADDSGLVVDALGGAPGVLSARFAGEHGDDEANNRKLMELLEAVPQAQRTARFVCAVVFLPGPDHPLPIICEGRWEGRIAHAPAGENGFGYDPLFVVPALECSAAELEPEHKDALSHRGKAMRALRGRLEASPELRQGKDTGHSS